MHAPRGSSGYRLTPGLSLLIHGFITYLTPILIIYALSHPILSLLLTLFPSSPSSPYASTLASLSNTHLARALLSFALLPLYAWFRIVFVMLRNRMRARALGARMVNTPADRWPGNVAVLRQMMEISRTGYPGDGLVELMNDNRGVFNLRPVFEDLIVTTEPLYIKTILSTDFGNYVKGDSFRNANRSVLGSGVFNADGDMWKFHRAMTRPFFNRDRISDFELFDRHAEDIIALLKSRLRSGYSIDFQDAMSRFTLDSATEFLFGSSVNSMSNGIPYPHHAPQSLPLRGPSTKELDARNPSADAFASAFLEAQFRVSQRIRSGWAWPLDEIWRDRTREPMRVVDGYVGPIVREAVMRKKNGERKAAGGEEKEGKVEGETLLDHLVAYTDDEQVLKEETINILIAGRDTTASTLTFMFFFLASHPHVATRLRTEVLEHVGPTRMPVYDDIKNMKYLRAVINETLRLYPVVPFNIRCSINETTWPPNEPNGKPYYIPANTRVSYSVFAMHRRPDLWGPDAEEFDPDRFLDERLKKYLLPNNFIFLPFNAGPRICLGQQFAYNEMSFITIRLMQQFSSFTLDRDSQPPNSLPPVDWALNEPNMRKGRDGLYPKLHLTMYNLGGLWLKMEESERKDDQVVEAMA